MSAQVQQTQQSQTHPAETSRHQPQAPFGSGTAAANDFHHQQVADKSGPSAVLSDASAKGQTTKVNGTTAAGQSASAASSSQKTATHSAGSKQDRTQQAERIVEEERQASEKLPNYPSLAERFTLLSKMGE